jgi:homogentisate phytyltransferase/homogentisate geranylgeranyltransferase
MLSLQRYQKTTVFLFVLAFSLEYSRAFRGHVSVYPGRRIRTNNILQDGEKVTVVKDSQRTSFPYYSTLSSSSKTPSSSIDDIISGSSWESPLPQVTNGEDPLKTTILTTPNHLDASLRDTEDAIGDRKEAAAAVTVAAADEEQPKGQQEKARKKDRTATPFPLVLWKFSRPHTLIGSALAIPALHLLAAPSLSQAILGSPRKLLLSILYATIPSLLMNIFITGLNQITDVTIDKINKPYLVIASGELSPKAASLVVTVCLLVSLLMGRTPQTFLSSSLATQGLSFSLWGSAILGTLYSLPPFRLKRFPLIAALSIVAVRGTIINAGFFAHASACVYGNTEATSWNCLQHNIACQLSSLYFGIFGIIIALMKDVPDLKGDQISNIRTFTVRIGPQKIFHAMRRLLFLLLSSTSIAFAWGAASALHLSSSAASLSPLALSRASISLLALYMALQSRRKGLHVNAQDGNEVYNYYMYLWKIFYQSYLVLPFAR